MAAVALVTALSVTLLADRAAEAATAAGATGAARARPVAPDALCKSSVYLTLDTGTMAHAESIAAILKRHQVRATFFLANETTPSGDGALAPAWDDYWRARLAEGHRFGSHTFDHVYFAAASGDRVRARPQFGPAAGRSQTWGAAEVCREIDRVDERFRQITGQPLDRVWRAPGGRGPASLFAMAAACGWRHVGWSTAGFLGDELPSDRFPNAALLAQSLRQIRDGDVLMAHLGIRSRQDPYAPTLDPLIAGLKSRGFCFRTLAEHPLADAAPRQAIPVTRSSQGQ